MIRNNKGFGLIQLIMVTAAMTAATLGFMKVSSLSSKSARMLTKRTTLNNYYSVMSEIVGVGSTCNQILSNDPVPTTLSTYTKNIPNLFNSDSDVIFTQGYEIEKDLILSQMLVDNLEKISETIYKADFNVKFHMGNKDLQYKVPMIVTAQDVGGGNLNFLIVLPLINL